MSGENQRVCAVVRCGAAACGAAAAVAQSSPIQAATVSGLSRGHGKICRDRLGPPRIFTTIPTLNLQQAQHPPSIGSRGAPDVDTRPVGFATALNPTHNGAQAAAAVLGARPALAVAPVRPPAADTAALPLANIHARRQVRLEHAPQARKALALQHADARPSPSHDRAGRRPRAQGADDPRAQRAARRQERHDVLLQPAAAPASPAPCCSWTPCRSWPPRPSPSTATGPSRSAPAPAWPATSPPPSWATTRPRAWRPRPTWPSSRCAARPGCCLSAW